MRTFANSLRGAGAPLQTIRTRYDVGIAQPVVTAVQRPAVQAARAEQPAGILGQSISPQVISVARQRFSFSMYMPSTTQTGSASNGGAGGHSAQHVSAPGTSMQSSSRQHCAFSSGVSSGLAASFSQAATANSTDASERGVM